MGIATTTARTNVNAVGADSTVLVGDSAMKHAKVSAVHEAIESAAKTTGKVIENGGELFSMPVTWLKTMQQDWLTYMIVLAVILTVIAIFYCTCCRSFGWQKANLSGNGLTQLAEVIMHKNAGLPNSLPLPFFNPPTVTATAPVPPTAQASSTGPAPFATQIPSTTTTS